MLKTWRGVSHFVALALVACGSEGVNVPAGSGEREPPASEDAAILVSAPMPRASLPGGTDFERIGGVRLGDSAGITDGRARAKYSAVGSNSWGLR